jgi:hypothetical protein
MIANCCNSSNEKMFYEIYRSNRNVTQRAERWRRAAIPKARGKSRRKVECFISGQKKESKVVESLLPGTFAIITGQ